MEEEEWDEEDLEEEEELKVQKKDGSLEPFMIEKITNSIKNAGGSSELAEEVANNVANWAKETAKNGVVATSDIRNKIIGLLNVKDLAVATKFQAYTKP
jgi:transcriptional regulator NrdR family protein